MRVLKRYERVVTFEDVHNDQKQVIVQLLLEHLHLAIIEESTPDYTAYSLATHESLET